MGVRRTERKESQPSKKFLDNVCLAAVKFIFFPRQNIKSSHTVLIRNREFYSETIDSLVILL